MVLTTTLRALRAIGEALQAQFEGSREVEVLVQGQWPKRRLIERFREGASQASRVACWWRRPRSGKASTCRATRCSWC
jgi:ATP-dependent DNA helicase DinG